MFFDIFVFLNFDTFCKFGYNSLEFQWIFDLKTANGHKIPQLLDAKTEFQNFQLSGAHHLIENRPT